MSTYTTGEMAKLCNISVRAVQFYDESGLLPPTDLSEGGRRLYTDNDLMKLRLICMLKAFGISLKSIKGILKTQSSTKVITLILDEQLKQLDNEIKERQKQVTAIKIVKNNIQGTDIIPVNSINDIEHIMTNRKGLRKVHGLLIGGAIPTTLVWWGTIAYWIWQSYWLPFAIYTPIHLVICFLLVLYLNRKTKYVCPECNEVFRPPFWKFAFTSGNKTRLLTCPKCGKKEYCVEVYANE